MGKSPIEYVCGYSAEESFEFFWIDTSDSELGTVLYACSNNPYGHTPRAIAPKVVRGCPQLTKAIIDAIPHKWKYSSGVLSFTIADAPTEAQQEELMDEFERLAFAGLERQNYNILWVRHEHLGRVELHFIIPRIELSTGKAFNAFPPGYIKKYKVLCDKFNYKYGWADPYDLRRAQSIIIGHEALIRANALRKNKAIPFSNKLSIAEHISIQVHAGVIKNRADIIIFLQHLGYSLPRIGKDYLTIMDKNGKRERLRGGLFVEEFDAMSWINQQEQKKYIVDVPDLEKSLQADRELKEIITRDALYNTKCYRQNLNLMNNEKNEVKEDKNYGTSYTSERNEEELRAENDAQYTRQQHSNAGANTRTIGGVYTSSNKSCRGSCKNRRRASIKAYFKARANQLSTTRRHEKISRHTTAIKGIYGEYSQLYSNKSSGDGKDSRGARRFAIRKIATFDGSYARNFRNSKCVSLRCRQTFGSSGCNVQKNTLKLLELSPYVAVHKIEPLKKWLKSMQLTTCNFEVSANNSKIIQSFVCKNISESKRHDWDAQMRELEEIWNGLPTLSSVTDKIHSQTVEIVDAVTLQAVRDTLIKQTRQRAYAQEQAKIKRYDWGAQMRELERMRNGLPNLSKIAGKIHTQAVEIMDAVTLQAVRDALTEQARQRTYAQEQAKAKKHNLDVQMRGLEQMQNELTNLSEIADKIHTQAVEIKDAVTLQAVRDALIEQINQRTSAKEEEFINVNVSNSFGILLDFYKIGAITVYWEDEVFIDAIAPLKKVFMPQREVGNSMPQQEGGNNTPRQEELRETHKDDMVM